MQRATGRVALAEQCARSVLSEYESLGQEVFYVVVDEGLLACSVGFERM
jgi:hypothetical protein